MPNITKQQAMGRFNKLNFDNARYYMGNPEADDKICQEWLNSFESFIINDYNENLDNFVFIVKSFNAVR